MSNEFVYQGRELEAMSFARNYHQWIFDVFRPYMGSRLVEVGAGNGSFSELLLTTNPESLLLVEPSSTFYELEKRAANFHPHTAIEIVHGGLAEAAARIGERNQPDSIFYINVLEHVEEDETELARIREMLAPGGRLFLFVPAFQSLYGSFDKSVGHYRRYTKAQLRAKCEAAHLKVIVESYFDSAGMIPWWIKYRLLRSKNMEPALVKIYDRMFVPALRRIETAVSPPFGKNLLLIAEK